MSLDAIKLYAEAIVESSYEKEHHETILKLTGTLRKKILEERSKHV